MNLYIFATVHSLMRNILFKPSSKIVYWTFQGGTPFFGALDFSVLCLLCLVRVCWHGSCDHLLGKGWPLGSCLWCLTLSLSLSQWYPGWDMVLDFIDSWSLHPYFIHLIDSCKAHLPVRYASSIESFRQKWHWCCDWQRATPEPHWSAKQASGLLHWLSVFRLPVPLFRFTLQQNR